MTAKVCMHICICLFPMCRLIAIEIKHLLSTNDCRIILHNNTRIENVALTKNEKSDTYTSIYWFLYE